MNADIPNQKSNPHYNPGITPKRVTNGSALFRGLAPWVTQRCRVVDDTASDLTGPGNKPTPLRQTNAYMQF